MSTVKGKNPSHHSLNRRDVRNVGAECSLRGGAVLPAARSPAEPSRTVNGPRRRTLPSKEKEVGRAAQAERAEPCAHPDLHLLNALMRPEADEALSLVKETAMTRYVLPDAAARRKEVRERPTPARWRHWCVQIEREIAEGDLRLAFVSLFSVCPRPRDADELAAFRAWVGELFASRPGQTNRTE